jgi:hypothetical protein
MNGQGFYSGDSMIEKMQALVAVALLVEYMQQQEALPDDGKRSEWNEYDRQHHYDAGEWARQILYASGRDDMGGCILCRR